VFPLNKSQPKKTSKILWTVMNVIGFYKFHVDGHTYICMKISPIFKDGQTQYWEMFKIKKQQEKKGPA
jgi:hypothetical protein